MRSRLSSVLKAPRPRLNTEQPWEGKLLELLRAFEPRTEFPTLASLPRASFHGHHRGGLTKIAQLASSTDIFIELRDCRIPVSSRNQLLLNALAGKPRVILYSKTDLVPTGGRRHDFELFKTRTREWESQVLDVIFFGKEDKGPQKSSFYTGTYRHGVAELIRFLRSFAAERDGVLTPLSTMVIGMPNVGKSTLVNALRAASRSASAKKDDLWGTKSAKVCQTGGDPGVTRKVSSAIRLTESVPGDEKSTVYLRDAPGIFVPYVSDPEAMLKLALCGCVKDGTVPAETLADYWLFKTNLSDPTAYARFHPPTNDILALLGAISSRLRKYRQRGVLDTDAAAQAVVHMFRRGQLGRVMLDDVESEGWQQAGSIPPSHHQARKADKARRLARAETG
jgi:hypothetical protein